MDVLICAKPQKMYYDVRLATVFTLVNHIKNFDLILCQSTNPLIT